jgi:hypothetical protein
VDLVIGDLVIDCRIGRFQRPIVNESEIFNVPMLNQLPNPQSPNLQCQEVFGFPLCPQLLEFQHVCRFRSELGTENEERRT